MWTFSNSCRFRFVSAVEFVFAAYFCQKFWCDPGSWRAVVLLSSGRQCWEVACLFSDVQDVRLPVVPEGLNWHGVMVWRNEVCFAQGASKWCDCVSSPFPMGTAKCPRCVLVLHNVVYLAYDSDKVWYSKWWKVRWGAESTSWRLTIVNSHHTEGGFPVQSADARWCVRALLWWRNGFHLKCWLLLWFRAGWSQSRSTLGQNSLQSLSGIQMGMSWTWSCRFFCSKGLGKFFGFEARGHGVSIFWQWIIQPRQGGIYQLCLPEAIQLIHWARHVQSRLSNIFKGWTIVLVRRLAVEILARDPLALGFPATIYSISVSHWALGLGVIERAEQWIANKEHWSSNTVNWLWAQSFVFSCCCWYSLWSQWPTANKTCCCHRCCVVPCRCAWMTWWNGLESFVKSKE